ncbi:MULTISPECIES: energy-coupling factor ABC transporter substrate-binding protein [Luteococcus]|uniref:Cobalt transport protein CbiN n=1 Tax=Luteococcus japonicus LSP_Lj1 TaxID=1255658 RepID=A0A1R4KFV5_9ACTN|nr:MULTISPECIES: energy-coupling factor ABC transporter substrate-binding protein [Luteococcus]MDN5563134.1 energy-coupling factor ABC transporter substrate-binding protein [Luteococcus sp.]SJN43158.1 Additional substrate-specific component CbiN of cobalt ECF transporter [Luteococcus japonicus LSP_Lj1]
MSEAHVTTRPVQRWVTPVLIAAIVAIFALCMALAPRPSGADAEAFGGTDAAVTEVLADKGVEPWFEPLFSPDSGEIESGLFALQAALGAGAFGFVLGNLRGRRAEHSKQD